MNGKAYFSFIGVLVVIVVMFVLGVTFLGGSDSSSQDTDGQPPVSDYADDNRSESVMLTRGRIRAEEQHTSYRITINSTSRVLEIIEGYEGVVVERQTFENSPAAYEEFLHALDGRGLEGVADGDSSDPRGVCPNTLLREYTLTTESGVAAYQWSGDCGVRTSKISGASSLYKNQIPDFSKTISNYSL